MHPLAMPAVAAVQGAVAIGRPVIAWAAIVSRVPLTVDLGALGADDAAAAGLEWVERVERGGIGAIPVLKDAAHAITESQPRGATSSRLTGSDEPSTVHSRTAVQRMA